MKIIHELLIGKRVPVTVSAFRSTVPGSHYCDICKHQTEPLLEVDIRLTGKGGILLWVCEACCTDSYFD